MNPKNERMTPSTMKAVVIDKITPASAAKLSVIEVPRVKPGWLLVRIRGEGSTIPNRCCALARWSATILPRRLFPASNALEK